MIGPSPARGARSQTSIRERALRYNFGLAAAGRQSTTGHRAGMSPPHLQSQEKHMQSRIVVTLMSLALAATITACGKESSSAAEAAKKAAAEAAEKAKEAAVKAG